MASPAHHLSHLGRVRPVVTRIVRLAWTGSLRAVNDARQQAAGLPWRFGSRLRHRIGKCHRSTRRDHSPISNRSQTNGRPAVPNDRPGSWSPNVRFQHDKLLDSFDRPDGDLCFFLFVAFQHRRGEALRLCARKSKRADSRSTSSAPAARQIIDASRYGASQLVITPQARLLRLVNGVCPAFVSETLSPVCRLLPGPSGAEGDRLKRGWESQSLIAPSLLTRPADRAATDNKEEPQPAVTS